MGDRARQPVFGRARGRAGGSVVRALPLWLLAALATTCSQVAAPAPEGPTTWHPVSGSRLSARYLVGDDGSRLFDGWFDTARGEYCRVARGQGNRYHCFPAANPVVYSDARCQQPLGQHLECAFRYTGVSRGDRRCGNDTLSLWQEGDPVSSTSRYRLTNDFCSGPDTSPGGTFVSLAARVPDSALVSGETQLRGGGLRLGPRVIRFEDGASAPFEMFDHSHGRACVQVETVAGSRCLPENAVYVGLQGPYYADDRCSQPVAHAYAPSCLRPSLALVVETVNGCTRVREAYRPGPRLDPRAVYTNADCQSGLIIPGHFYELGTPVDLASFPELKSRETSTGRIRVRTYSAADDVAIPPLGQRLFDSQLGVECKVAVAADGVLRCLPLSGPALVEGETSASGFGDAGCTRPLARYNPSGGCPGPMPAMAGVARASQKRCLGAADTGRGSRDDRQPGRWEIYRLGRKHEGQLFFLTSGACQPGATPPGDEYYEMEEAVPPDTFVAFREE